MGFALSDYKMTKKNNKKSSFWMYDSSLVREQPKVTGQTMGGLQLAKPTPLVGERQQWQGSSSSKESMAVAERRGW